MYTVVIKITDTIQFCHIALCLKFIHYWAIFSDIFVRFNFMHASIIKYTRGWILEHALT